MQTTSTQYPVKSTCGDSCHYCNYLNPTNSCTTCFTSTYNNFNFLYSQKGKCYQTCPVGTYNYNFICYNCHPICSSCLLNSKYDSCVSCASTYVMNSGVCESTCGKSMYMNSAGKCNACHPNCLGCLSTN